jgi:Na+/H+-translocating membrane pyrophosphatase
MNTVIQWHVILFTVLLFVIASFLYPLYAWRYASQYAQMPEVEEISNLIKNGARAYLSEQWKFLIQAVTTTVVLGGLVVNYYNGFTHAVVLCAGFVVLVILQCVSRQHTLPE